MHQHQEVEITEEMQDMELSFNGVKKLIKGSVQLRVSDRAVDELREELEDEFAREIAEEAVALAEHDGRKTVRRSDVRQAVRSRRDQR